ncbi:DUF3168 domain-containing protein [Phyllobacterium sp. 628]|uniref:DUF3168 domain-containing protein n=1 Tax=Phyllobacterium sp. 628 TaxID=2718938 RepID=UPI001662868F|nr:DUF3168 domain-containing protein [Phyllobacterium sp. 628]QND52397.1 DUF3168 domain-containing protein [Phyllobacterium sp. 628]
MSSAGLQLQKALLKALKADAELNDWVDGRIYDHVPSRSEFPYITFGSATGYDWSTATERGSEHLMTLQVWSRGDFRKTVFEIMDRISRVLGIAPLKLDAHELINLNLEYTQAIAANSRDGYAGTMRYRAVTEEVSASAP